MTIIALDPGVTTGVAIRVDEIEFAQVDGKPLTIPTGNKVYHTLVIHKPSDLWSIFDTHHPSIVIFEDFNSAGLISKDGQATLRLIGAIEAVTYRLNIPTCLQYPRERYPFIEPARRMIRATNKKYLIHEVDALSHLLLYEDRVQRGVLEKITANRRSNKVQMKTS